MSPGRYRFQSKNTREYVVTMIRDAPGDVVRTTKDENSIPDISVVHILQLYHFLILTVNPDITGDVTTATITGFKNFYISLQGDAENAVLTWSKEEYKWIIRATGQGSSVITPANGADRYWVGEIDIQEVLAKPGKDVQPPQNEWFLVGFGPA
ncbi:hypothetical protein BYT27DRAFT_7208380 [Phlegmacium glaucopus]|nr:hypothetical protein BYT27DRAFT_7208380 [Phlegmacium glaucopus]